MEPPVFLASASTNRRRRLRGGIGGGPRCRCCFGTNDILGRTGLPARRHSSCDATAWESSPGKADELTRARTGPERWRTVPRMSVEANYLSCCALDRVAVDCGVAGVRRRVWAPIRSCSISGRLGLAGLGRFRLRTRRGRRRSWLAPTVRRGVVRGRSFLLLSVRRGARRGRRW